MIKITKIFLAALLALGLLSSVSTAANKADANPAPTTNNGNAWRIGYLEAGPYINYQRNLIALVKGLMELGWIEERDIPPQQGEQTDRLWQWLSEKAGGRHIQFVADAHYSGDWSDESSARVKAEAIGRLNAKKDIDLMIAAGTSAGKLLSNDEHGVNTIVVSSTDPVAAGIVKSVEDSGRDHIHATLEPNRYTQDIDTFYEVVGFKKLGVAYEDTEVGRSIAAMGDIRKVAARRGFEVAECHTIDTTPDAAVADKSALECFEKLAAEKVDGIYVVQQQGVNAHNLPALLKIAADHNIPTFSQNGSHEVKSGVFMSMSNADLKYYGQFFATTIARIFNGAKPRQVTQTFNAPKRIALNLKTAENIHFGDIPIAVLMVADDLFETIEQPQ